MPASRRILLGVLALVLLVTAGYAPTRQGGYLWDDDSYLTANTTLTEPGGLRRIWLEPRATPQYYPLIFSSFWVEQRLWGLRPAGYHIVNVAIHLGNALLLWLLLSRVGFPLAWTAAAVFALHPLQVESVAWITERKNVLSGLFYLLAAIAYLPILLGTRAAGGAAGDRDRRFLTRAWLTAFFCFACALLSKSVTATLPVALLLLAWWRRGEVTRRDVGLLAPFFTLGAASGLFTAWRERIHVGALGADWLFSFDERLVIAGKNIWFYLAKTLWPHPLMFTYPRWQPHGYPLWHLAAPGAALALALLLWRSRSRLGRGPLAAYLFFLVTLAPALGFLNFYPMRFSFVADHFFYLGIIGPILGVFWGAIALRPRQNPESPAAGRYRRVAGAAIGALVLLLAALSHDRSTVFLSEETLWRDTLAKNPAATSARVNLGTLLAKRGEHREALELFQTALDAEPHSADILANLGSAHLELGTLLAEQGALDSAAGHFRQALALDPSQRDARYNLGKIMDARGDLAQAIVLYREAVRIDPSDAEALNNLGVDLALTGRPEEAAAHFREALRVRPGYREAAVNLDGLRSPATGIPVDANSRTAR